MSLLTSQSAEMLKPWLVCLSAALFFFYDFIQMSMCNALGDVLMRDLGVDATSLGYLSSTFLLADVLFLFPAGLLLDRLSIRQVILVTLSLSVLGTLGFALAENFHVILLCRFVSGIAHAFCFLCCMLLAVRWFPPARQAMVVGIIVTIAMLGGLVAQTPLSLLSEAIGWRQALLWDTALGAATWVLVWFLVEDHPAHLASMYQQQRRALQSMGFWQGLRLAVTNRQNWLFGIYTGLLNLPIMLLGALWGVLFLTQVHGVSKLDATNIASMIYLGTIVGAPMMGWLSDRWGKRRAPMLWGAALSLLVVTWVMTSEFLAVPSLLVAFFMLGLFTSCQVISYPGVTESNATSISGTAMGLVSSLIMSLGAIAQPFTGWLLDMRWDGTLVDGVPQYLNADFVFALSIIPVGFVLGWLCAYGLRETYGHNQQQQELS